MKKGILFVMAAAFLASCQQEEENGVASSVDRVTITPIITRATEVNFEDQDQIGLTITKEDGTVYADNELMTFNDGAFAGSLKWYPEGADKSTFVAYYPYTGTGTPTSFSVQTNQTEGYEASDFMAASKSEVLPSANSISMLFKHMLTKLVINVTNETNLDISSVVLKGSIPSANIDLGTMHITAKENTATADITAQQVTKNTVYRAIIVPQTVAFTLAVTTADHTTLTQKLVSTTLAQGGQYSVNVRVLPDNIIVTLSGEIENWTDEGEIGADNTVPFEEHPDENYFLYDGVKYNTVTLANGTTWMAEPLCYLPKGYSPSADPADLNAHIWYPYQLIDNDGDINSLNADGAEALTDEASIKKLGYLYDMYAALGGKEVTVDNCYNFEGVQGICPKGWHIPTHADFFALCGYSNATATGSAATDENALFYDATGSGGGKISKYNDAGWNYVLSGCVFKSTLAGTGRYQLTRIWSGNSTSTELYGQASMNYIMSSTCYQPNAAQTNIQFFGQMTTFTTSYPEGRITLGYVSAATGQQLRCVKDKAAE